MCIVVTWQQMINPAVRAYIDEALAAQEKRIRAYIDQRVRALARDERTTTRDEHTCREGTYGLAAHASTPDSDLIVAASGPAAAKNAQLTTLRAAAQMCTITEKKVYERVMSDLQPQINYLNAQLKYTTEDGQLTVDTYRRALDKAANPDAYLALTDGSNRGSSKVIRHGVSMYFGNDD